MVRIIKEAEQPKPVVLFWNTTAGTIPENNAMMNSYDLYHYDDDGSYSSSTSSSSTSSFDDDTASVTFHTKSVLGPEANSTCRELAADNDGTLTAILNDHDKKGRPYLLHQLDDDDITALTEDPSFFNNYSQIRGGSMKSLPQNPDWIMALGKLIEEDKDLQAKLTTWLQAKRNEGNMMKSSSNRSSTAGEEKSASSSTCTGTTRAHLQQALISASTPDVEGSVYTDSFGNSIIIDEQSQAFGKENYLEQNIQQQQQELILDRRLMGNALYYIEEDDDSIVPLDASNDTIDPKCIYSLEALMGRFGICGQSSSSCGPTAACGSQKRRVKKAPLSSLENTSDENTINKNVEEEQQLEKALAQDQEPTVTNDRMQQAVTEAPIIGQEVILLEDTLEEKEQKPSSETSTTNDEEAIDTTNTVMKKEKQTLSPNKKKFRLSLSRKKRMASC